MAHLDYLGANDPDTVASTQLAHDLGLLIMSQTDRVNIAITGLTHALSAALTYVPESEFESTLSCVCESMRVSRATMLAPPKRDMN